MDYPISKVAVREASSLLTEIPKAPSHVYVRGMVPPQTHRCLAVVGSRNYSDYGKQVVEYLVHGLKGYPISIVSGLALGIDACAHTAALSAGLHTLAIPGSGLDESVLYPRSHQGLAHRILDAGGGLLSEFEPHFQATQWSFPQRNRIMAGMAHAVLLVEAGEKSGTLITARLAADFNRDVLVVPGNIFAENSRGTHQFLKLGATPITSPEDILAELHIEPTPSTASSDVHGLTDVERAIIACLTEPRDHDTIVRLIALPTEEVLMVLTQLELQGLIAEQNGVVVRLK